MLSGDHGRRTVLSAAVVISAWCTASMVGFAQQSNVIPLPADTVVAGHIDVEALKKNEFGKRLVELIAERMFTVVAEGLGVARPTIKDVENFLGFNPVEELRTISFAATDMESSTGGIVVMAQLKKSLGNVKHLVTTSPDYASETIGGYDFQSLSIQGAEAVAGDQKVHFAIHTDADGLHTVVLSQNQELVKQQLGKIDSTFSGAVVSPTSSETAVRSFEFVPTPNALLNISVVEVPPADKLGGGPQTILAKLLKSLNVLAKNESDRLQLAITLVAKDGSNADQLEQLIHGFAPMLEEPLAQVSDGLKIEREGETVSLSLSADSAKATEVLNEQFDMALGMIEASFGVGP